MSYQVGEIVVSEATFRDDNRELVDPATVTFSFRRPTEAADTVWTYPTSPGLVRIGPGIYEAHLTLDIHSTIRDWRCEWRGTGSGIQRIVPFSVRVAKPRS